LLSAVFLSTVISHLPNKKAADVTAAFIIRR